ncbi:helix-turn-helix domain-containing protein [Klebsiella pneumoniae]|nr:helix-turn-helix domain-containing protein [Klebsiella pneumoniae]
MSTHEITFRHVDEKKKSLIMQNRGGQAVIERILEAYGFSSRQAFCNHLGISQSTMANRYARDTFPADWVVICSMETGVSIEWLAFGTDTEMESFADKSHDNCNSESRHLNREPKNPNENTVTINQNGKAAIERIVAAYGFKTRQALADHLGISKSTLANRYMRDTFPADWIIQCALETGISLDWLVTGKGSKSNDVNTDVAKLLAYKLINGKLIDADYIHFDKSLIPHNLIDPQVVIDSENVFVVDYGYKEISDGEWLVEIEGKINIRTLVRIPVGKVKVISTHADFICDIENIKLLAKCHCAFIKNI